MECGGMGLWCRGHSCSIGRGFVVWKLSRHRSGWCGSLGDHRSPRKLLPIGFWRVYIVLCLFSTPIRLPCDFVSSKSSEPRYLVRRQNAQLAYPNNALSTLKGVCNKWYDVILGCTLAIQMKPYFVQVDFNLRNAHTFRSRDRMEEELETRIIFHYLLLAFHALYGNNCHLSVALRRRFWSPAAISPSTAFDKEMHPRE